MKTAVIPQIRVEPELLADLASVLKRGETLTECHAHALTALVAAHGIDWRVPSQPVQADSAHEPAPQLNRHRSCSLGMSAGFPLVVASFVEAGHHHSQGR